VNAMNIDRLHERLTDLDVKFSKPTLKRLSYQDLISRPEPAKLEERTPGKKGKEASYKEETVAEAAAVWAIKEAFGTKNLPSKSRIDVIKEAVDLVYKTPFPYCRISNCGKGTPGGIGGMKLAQEVVIKYVSEDFDGLSLFPGRDKIEQSKKLDELVVAWVCATEKVKKGYKVNDPKKVVLWWWQDIGPIITVDTPNRLRRITVEDAEHDEIVPYWNGEDVRRLLLLLTGGPDAWLRWKDSLPH
jgi:hypothetical protein